MSAAEARERPRRDGLAFLALAAATFAVYGRVAGHEFVSLDDGSYISANPQVSAGLTREGLVWAFTHFHSSNWHPLTWLSHMLDVQLFGLDAGKHHLVNVGLHALNACLCFAGLRRMTRAWWPSLLVAFLFALHPLRVESVAWAAERKDVLSGTFFFLTLLAYERYARVPSLARYAWVLLAVVLGLLAKPMLVTLPPLLLLLDVWPLARREGAHPAGWKRLVVEKLPLFLLTMGSMALTLAAQRAGGAMRSFAHLDASERVATALLGYAAYLGKSLWPFGLACFYPHPALDAPRSFEPFGAAVLGAAALLAGLTGLAVAVRRRMPAVPVGWFWFLGMLVPVIGLVQVGRQWIADRYAYLPLIGIYVALVFGLRGLVPPRRERAAVAIGFALAALCGVVSFVQVGTWRTSETLYAHAVEVDPRNSVAQINLGAVLELRGDLVGAREHYEAALEAAPRQMMALDNLIRVLQRLGDREAAIAALQRKLRLRPDDAAARRKLLQLGGELPPDPPRR